MRAIPIVVGLSIAAAISAVAQRPSFGTSSLALTHVTVVDVSGDQPLNDATVVITGDRISALGKAGTIATPPGAQVVDATGKYLIPGLWDMHVHLSYATARYPQHAADSGGHHEWQASGPHSA